MTKEKQRWGSIQADVHLITPKEAQRMLDKNDMNRPLVKSIVSRYAEEIKAGHWECNGEPIILNGDGTLLDGQHRLHAVIEANEPIWALIVRGVKRDAFDTIDQGRRRTGSDALGALNYQYRHSLAAAARLIAMWRVRKPGGGWNESFAISNSETVEIVSQTPALEFSTSRIGASNKLRSLMHPGMAAWLHYEFHRRNPDKAKEFFDLLESGENLAKGNPVFHLRERLSDNRGAKAKLRRGDVAALVIKAWNAHQAGHPVRLLRWANDEPFPDIEPPLTED